MLSYIFRNDYLNLSHYIESNFHRVVVDYFALFINYIEYRIEVIFFLID